MADSRAETSRHACRRRLSRGLSRAVIGMHCLPYQCRCGRCISGRGAPLDTPFGSFVPPNITPDLAGGIGNWTLDQVAVALRQGVRPMARPTILRSRTSFTPTCPIRTWQTFGQRSRLCRPWPRQPLRMTCLFRSTCGEASNFGAQPIWRLPPFRRFWANRRPGIGGSSWSPGPPIARPVIPAATWWAG